MKLSITKLLSLLLSSSHLMSLGTATTTTNDDPIPASTRAHWMRVAKDFLFAANGGSPCPFAAFGAAIVNHTSFLTTGGLGDLVCLGVNTVHRDGNPTLHGEIAALNNCSEILTSTSGQYKYSGPQALDALKELSLYTTAEPCPMCASAIASGQFAECIIATSVPDLAEWGWPQNKLRSLEVFAKAPPRAGHPGSVNPTDRTRILQGVLREETDELFGWQFRQDGACPSGCVRSAASDDVAACIPAAGDKEHDEL